MPASKFKTLIQRLRLMKSPRIVSRPKSLGYIDVNVNIDRDRRRYRVDIEVTPFMELEDIQFTLKNHELSIHGTQKVYLDCSSVTLSKGVLTHVASLPAPVAKKVMKPGGSTICFQKDFYVIMAVELFPILVYLVF